MWVTYGIWLIRCSNTMLVSLIFMTAGLHVCPSHARGTVKRWRHVPCRVVDTLLPCTDYFQLSFHHHFYKLPSISQAGKSWHHKPCCMPGD